MKIKFVKNAFGYKADQEIEVTAEEAKAFGDAAVEVKAVVEPGDVSSKAVDELLASVDAKIEAVEKKIAKAFSNRKAAIVVGEDRVTLDPLKGFKSVGDYTRSVAKGYDADPRFKAAGLGYDAEDGIEVPASIAARIVKSSGMNETTAGDGGNLVPVSYSSTLYQDIKQGVQLLPLTTNFPIVGNSTFVPADNTTTIGTSGVTAYWVDEGVAPTASKAAVRKFQLTPKKLAVLTYLTSELLQDNNVGVESYVIGKANYAINYAVNSAIVRGNGSGKPTGFIGHAATVTQLRDTANQVKYADVANMYSRFYGNVNAAVWLVNQEVWAQLAQMTSGNYNIFLSSNSITGMPVLSMFGIPVEISEHMSSLGVEGDIALIDPTAYTTATIGGVTSAVSMHLKFDTDELAYRWTFRVDGRPARSAALTPASGQGTKTLSPFVVLDDATT